MNRKRKTGRNLPRRVYKKHGGYYFVPVEPMRDPREKKNAKPKAWIRLCSVEDGEVAMLRALADVLGAPQLVEGSMPYCCDEFAARKLSSYTESTRTDYKRYLAQVSYEFQSVPAAEVTTRECADFLRLKYSDKANTARKVAALMAKLFRFVIGELGLRQDNPMDQLDMGDYKATRREVLMTHEQLQAIRDAGMLGAERKDTGKKIKTISGPVFAAIIDMTYLLWARAIDIRTMRDEKFESGVIRIKPSKTLKTSGKAVDITITPAIQEVIDRARAIKRERGIISPYLFATTKGTAYSKNGLSIMWDRAKERAKITADVTFRDIRALGATDAARSKVHRDEIQKRLVHTSGKTTDIYIKEVIPEVSDLAIVLPWANKAPKD